MIGDSGAYASVGGKVLERGAGHACWPYDVPNVDVVARARRTRTTRRAAPCAASAPTRPRSPWKGPWTCSPRSAGSTAGRSAGATPSRSGACSPRARSSRSRSGSRRRSWRSSTSTYEHRRAGRAVGLACGIKNSGIGNGVLGVGQGRLVVEKDGDGLDLQRLHRDGPGAAHRPDPVRGARSTGLRRERLPPQGRLHVRARLRADDGLARDALRRARGGRRPARSSSADLDAGKTLVGPRGRSLRGRRASSTTRRLSTPRWRRSRRTPPSASRPRSCILDAAGKLEKVIAAHDVGRAVNPALCPGRSRARSTWGSATRSPRSCPCEDGDAGHLHACASIGVLRARDMPTIEVILVEDVRARGAVRREGGRRDRPRPDRRRRRRGARHVRRHPPHDAADEGFACGQSDERRPPQGRPEPLSLRCADDRAPREPPGGGQRPHTPLQRPGAAGDATAFASTGVVRGDPRARVVEARSRPR